MKIQINTDKHIEGREEFITAAEEEVAKGVGHLARHVTRVEVHVGDQNAAKGGLFDKRCMMEARLAGRPPIAVTHEASTAQLAMAGATKKLRRALENALATN